MIKNLKAIIRIDTCSNHKPQRHIFKQELIDGIAVFGLTGEIYSIFRRLLDCCELILYFC
ncbi:hypothetical protein ES703_31701 [subsurface metagenome]